MSAIPTVDELYESAREFAHTAIAAFRDRQPRRTAMDAGTALEHLAKAVLVKRSAGLLVNVRNGDVMSLIRLLGVEAHRPPIEAKGRPVRTIGMRDAVARAELFISHTASSADLSTLYDLRDGVVHAAARQPFDTRVLVAFVTIGDAFLSDLGRDRSHFWAGHREAVDALLSEAASQVEAEVAFSMAAARARAAELYGSLPEQAREPVMSAREIVFVDGDQDLATCPACRRWGVATGSTYVEWSGDARWDEPDGAPVYDGDVKFDAESFQCPVCGLSLPSLAHMLAAGLTPVWKIDGLDPYMIEPDGPEFYDPSDDGYEAMRDRVFDHGEA